MRKWMLNLHLYGGLLCAPYLIIFGFSSLDFNHHFGFARSDSKAVPVVWEAPVNVASSTNNEQLAESVRESLGLMGWTLPWTMQRDGEGELHFDVERPGKSYKVWTQLKDHRARVETRAKGFWPVMNSLHAMGAVPGARLTSWWGGYTEICTGFVLFAAVSGLYLWVNSKRERWVGIIALISATLFSIALMVLVVYWG